jgi:hypothetical protein
MSHVVSIKTKIIDLDALEAALARDFPQARLVRGQTTYNWFGTHVGDYPLPEGFSKEDLGKCEHAIVVDGVRYQIGLARARGDTSPGLSPLFDFFGSSSYHDGQKLKELFGDGLGRLVQSYGAAKVERMMRRKGYTSIRRTVQPDGRIRLRACAPA